MSKGYATPASDIVLLRRAHTGDGAAFATVYDRHAAAAYRVAARLLPNGAAAEDVVQEAFLTLWRTNRYDARQGSVRAYLLAIVHNRAIDRLRRDRRHQAETPIDATVSEHLAGNDRTDLHVERGAVAAAVRAAIKALPREQRTALELAYYAGLTHLEIAALRQEPVGTVKGRVRLGIQKLGRDPGVVACR